MKAILLLTIFLKLKYGIHGRCVRFDALFFLSCWGSTWCYRETPVVFGHVEFRFPLYSMSHVHEFPFSFCGPSCLLGMHKGIETVHVEFDNTMSVKGFIEARPFSAPRGVRRVYRGSHLEHGRTYDRLLNTISRETASRWPYFGFHRPMAISEDSFCEAGQSC